MNSSPRSNPSAADLRRKAGGRRNFSAPIIWSPETRQTADGELLLKGTAAVFDSDSEDLGGFIEQIAPGAFRRSLNASGADPMLLFSHNPDAILARRSAGTLDLRESDHGLEIEARIVPTQLGRDVFLLVQSGHLRSMSFGFTVGRDTWSGRGKKMRRRITEVANLFEVSVVANPAYQATSVKTRDREALATELEELRERARAVLEKKGRPLATTNPKRVKRRLPTVKPVDPYGPGSDHSWFMDQMILAGDEKRRHQIPNSDSGLTPEAREAKQRLGMVEERALTTATGTGGDFTPTGAIPTSIAEQFGIAARARAIVSNLIPSEGLPNETGMSVSVPRFTAQSSVAVQAVQADAPSSSSPSTGLTTSPVVSIAGSIEVSRQAFDRAVPRGFDTAITAELGAALAERLEVQVLNGTGADGQLSGLLNNAGTTVTWTQSSPTVSGAISKIGETISSVHQAAGVTPDLVAVHPRRLAWITSQPDSTGQPVRYQLPAQVIAAPAIPLDGSSRDQVLTISSPGVRLYRTEPKITVVSDYSGASTLTVKIIANLYAALVYPKGTVSVGKLSGSGLAAPSFTS